MEYISLLINNDAAHDCLVAIGELSAIQFTDLNPDLTPFQRRYVSYVKRCGALERKLRFFSRECHELGLTLPAITTTTSSSTPGDASAGEGVAKERLLDYLESEIDGRDVRLRELKGYNEKLTADYERQMELRDVLVTARRFYRIDAPRLSISELTTREEESEERRGTGLAAPLLRGDDEDDYGDIDIRFSIIAGMVASEEVPRFERMIFRVTRGNCFLRFADRDQRPNTTDTDPLPASLSSSSTKQSVFIIFYKSPTIGSKLKKICDAFSARRYLLPDMNDDAAVERTITEISHDTTLAREVLVHNGNARYEVCRYLATGRIADWTTLLLREKTVYHTLNMFKSDVSGILRGEGWVTSASLMEVRRAVKNAHVNRGVERSGFVEIVAQPWPTPPTYFRLNKFTAGYQEFVNTYGIPRYGEANPALFTAGTFPFLFGVMYGDIGHGLCVLFAGLYLLKNEKANDSAKLSEIQEGLHIGRYMLTMMGFFAVYAGFLYNDMFSLGLNLFGTRWQFEGQKYGNVTDQATATLIYDYGSDESVYPFGLDPMWHLASNELLFFNSFKMKLSVIIGITQMFMGTCLKGLNDIYFGEKLNFFFEFLPMVTFAVSLFVYMVFLIFYKWSIDWNSRMLSATCIKPDSDAWGTSDYKEGEWILCDNTGDGTCTPWGYSCTGNDNTATKCPLNFGGSGDGCQPPNLITTLINIALQPGTVDEPMYKGQATVQIILLLVAFLSVPVLLFAKPCILSMQMARTERNNNRSQHGQETTGEYEQIHTLQDTDTIDDDHETHSFGETLIHQAIETIEFVLGMISNTASYLRLWALSLAHSELAQVFWQKAMLTTINMNFLATYFGYAVFAGITFAVLLMMDVLECFLHALRLQWVEFQNKFFKADGVQFQPCSFRNVILEHASR